MGNKQGKKQKNPTTAKDIPEDFDKLAENCNITGASWKEFHHKLLDHLGNDDLLDREWQALGQKQQEQKEQGVFTEAKKIVNMSKNRYPNILAYDATRVKLALVEGAVGSDYINANFVDSGMRRYICTQAPLHNTAGDFHRMLWETDCRIIVMLTNIIEQGSVKAFEYLPKIEPENDEDVVDEEDKQLKYGDILVKSEDMISGPDKSYSVRNFSQTKNGETRKITRFQFTDWPDQETPDTAKLLSFIEKISEQVDQVPKSPIVIHCSAGVGRTGTWILLTEIFTKIDSAVKKKPSVPPTINVMQSITHLRGMREGLVNHPDQYKFCFQTIADHTQRVMTKYGVT